MAPPERFELPTPPSEAECSNPLSYGGWSTKALYNKMYMFMKIKKNHLILAYIVFLVFSYIYIKNVLKQSLVPVQDTPKEEKKAIDVKDANVILKVDNGNTLRTYHVTLKNTDSLYDLLERLRNKDTFTYEKIAYVYGTELDFINGEKAPEGYKWKLYDSGKDVTYSASKINLVDGNTYSLALTENN